MDHHNLDVMPAPIVTPLPCFADNRGWFMPVREEKNPYDGRPWVQGNVSMSYRGVLRGLHFQHPGSQAKLLTVLQGEIFDVVVDIRRDSPEFGKAQCLTLRATEAQQLFIPRGYAHGFLVLSMEAIVYYKIDARYAVDYEQVLCWNDSQLGISWPLTADPILSAKDATGRSLQSFTEDELPTMTVD
jgi:dTDP-4-dehydrorhamnose 3,5-epimerase